MTRRRLAVLVAIGAPLLVWAAPLSAGKSSGVGCDFNGDGFEDLAVGVPNDEVGGEFNAGSVHVIYGTETGLSASGDQVWHRNKPGINGTAAAFDRFGAVVDCGDFDGDGFDDLAVGVPLDDVGDDVSAGSVHVIYGTEAGLSASGDQVWHRNKRGIKAAAGQLDRFGWSVAVGDYDGDGFDDLAVGVPHHLAGGDFEYLSGSVHVIYGTESGLTAADDQVWHRDRPGMKASAEEGDELGFSLAAGDFDGDGKDDLAVGVPFDEVGGGEDGGPEPGPGSVHVLYGTEAGLSASGDQIFHRDRPGMKAIADDGDNFALSMTAGDFNGDGRDDLGLGVPRDEVGGETTAGSVHVIYGTDSGLSVIGDQIWHRNKPGINASAERGDQFGSSVTSGDFNESGKDDLAVGAPYDVFNMAAAGSVHVIYGSESGLAASGDQMWHRDRPGVKGTTWAGAGFGVSVAGGDFNGSGKDDLAVGVPGDLVGGHDCAGSVHVIYGTGSGLSASGDQVWHRNKPGIKANAAVGESFGLVSNNRRHDF